MKSNYESLPDRIREVQKYRQDVSKGGKGLLWDSADVNKYEVNRKQNLKDYQQSEQLHEALLNAGASEEDITAFLNNPEILSAIIAKSQAAEPLAVLVSDAREVLRKARREPIGRGLTSLAID